MTTTFNVHIYREMRLAFSGIEASSHAEAASIARRKATEEADSIDDCEGDNLAALVDLQGDETHEHSRVIDFAEERLRRSVPILRAALQTASDDMAGGRGDDEAEVRVFRAIRDALAVARMSGDEGSIPANPGGCNL